MTPSPAAVPFFILALGCSERPSFLAVSSHFGPTALALASAGTVILLIASLLAIVRAAFANGALPQSISPNYRGLVALSLLALSGVVFTAKLVLMRAYVVATPFWDQWGAEGQVLYIPFNDCTLGWRQMFALHNEHRVFFTRLLALSLLVLDGQWDPRLQQVVNAGLHAIAACVLLVTLWVANERRRLDVLALLCAIAFAPPFAWENTLFGFQSAFYWQLLFFVLAIGLTTTYRFGGLPWCLGWLCAICGLVTAAGGLFAPAAILLVSALGYLDDEAGRRRALTAMVAVTTVFAAGYWLSSPPLAPHAPLKAHAVSQFVLALSRDLAWPWIDRPWLIVMTWLPVLALFGMICARRLRTTSFERLVLGLSVWVLLQAVAIAYGRGSGGPPPSSRYQDFLSIGFVANGAALLVILQQASTPSRRRATAAGVGGWLLVAGIGIEQLSVSSMSTLNDWHKFWLAHTTNVRRFVLTDNVAEFASKQPFEELPYPDAQALIVLLHDRFIRTVLPAAVRKPIAVQPATITNGAFVPEGTYPTTTHDPSLRAWGSFTEVGNPVEGRFESDLIPGCGRGSYLSFELAGYIGLPQLSLATREVRSGKEVHIVPAQPPREAWKPVLISCPHHTFTVVAVDARPDYWFSFREPVEIGWASVWAEALVASAWELLFLSLGLVLVCAWLA